MIGRLVVYMADQTFTMGKVNAPRLVFYLFFLSIGVANRCKNKLLTADQTED